MNRRDSIKFKLMEDGHIRGIQTNRPDLPSASELQIYPPYGVSPTVSVAHTPLILVTDEALAYYLKQATKRI